jgi:histidinol-phosphate phosphatase family protein
MSGRPAAFLDRDGTIIHDAKYVRDPRDVALLPGAADAIRRLNANGIAVIVVTNQSGIARRYLTESDYDAVRARLDTLLAAEHARIDATFMCPHYPAITGACECRKPGVLLYHTAIDAHTLDPTRSLFAGDRWRDVEPGVTLGGYPVLLDADSTPADDRARAKQAGMRTAASLSDAVDAYLTALPTLHRPS